MKRLGLKFARGQENIGSRNSFFLCLFYCEIKDCETTGFAVTRKKYKKFLGGSNYVFSEQLRIRR